MPIQFGNLYVPENFNTEFAPIKEKIESLVNLSKQADGEKRYSIQNNKLMRICLLTGLGTPGKRDVATVEKQKLHFGNRYLPSFFSHQDLTALYSALIKMRYHDTGIDIGNNMVLSRILAAEMARGRDYLLEDNNLEGCFLSQNSRGGAATDIPVLNLLIGNYGDAEMEATLDINSRAITNAQIIIAGATGSGKTNLLAVLMQQFRAISTESRYPVNFLLFDYKGEFSDIQNNSWLSHFDVDRTAILNPIESPLPFTPFKDFTGRPLNEINLYSTEMASALASLDRLAASSNMSNRLSEAIVYFLMSKLNNIYEQLPQQAANDDVVEIRHFSIIDEAHYMLSFDNRPLRNLIAVGRNKGLSVILATQNMADFKSKYFDFYANAQYPLIMKQQTIDDKVIRDLFGVNGQELTEIRQAIAGLQKGELIIKDQTAFALGIGKKYKKIKVTHLI